MTMCQKAALPDKPVVLVSKENTVRMKISNNNTYNIILFLGYLACNVFLYVVSRA